ncbi:hypothetical protein AKJ59_00565 [candidate division MSBL1 archaeon SCGC-AAA385M02]|uniref:CO dehydrogenase/acetyl-CoA synthase complex subunit epsilon n=1 Tax=candidate division MSBL1 archaeon SCGC-AAA385M02 TaxID=1698287 RepID=A0A133VQM0_9EURY|nr:hypothetical protein AKJ59_00565 [candidate division MSBL1 archaeon SCGC-AAA385M02]
MWGETTSGSKSAIDLKPKAAGKLLARAKSVLFILGSDLNEYPPKTIKKIIKKANSIIVETGSAKASDIGIEANSRYGIVEVVDLLCSDDGWRGRYDYIVFVGVPYHIESRMLSGLRLCNVGSTITLNRRHQQYADFSFPNILRPKFWEKSLKEIAKNMQ